MPNDDPPTRRALSRESRLLLVTIGVSVLVLFTLARLRFPTPPATADVSPPPLQRLAARASYEDLAASLEGTESATRPAVVVLRVAPADDSAPLTLRQLLRSPGTVARAHYVPALRMGTETAVAAIPAGARIEGIVGAPARTGTAAVTATDPVRGLAWLRVPPAEAPPRLRVLALDSARGPAYVAAVEGTRAGVTTRPVFLGRADRFGSPRWRRALLPLGGAPAAPGALMFSLDGEFIGIVVDEQQSLAIAAAADVLETGRQLGAGGGSTPVDLGLSVQSLTPSLARAAGVTAGIVVAAVADGSAAAMVVQAGDVITQMDGQPVTAPDTLLFRLSALRSGSETVLTRVRGGTAADVTMTIAGPAGGEGPPAALRLALVRGQGTRIEALSPESPLARAGVRVDDLIVAAADLVAPTPAQLRRLLGAGSGNALAVVIRRGDGQWAIGVDLDAAR